MPETKGEPFYGEVARRCEVRGVGFQPMIVLRIQNHGQDGRATEELHVRDGHATNSILIGERS